MNGTPVNYLVAKMRDGGKDHPESIYVYPNTPTHRPTAYQ